MQRLGRSVACTAAGGAAAAASAAVLCRHAHRVAVEKNDAITLLPVKFEVHETYTHQWKSCAARSTGKQQRHSRARHSAAVLLRTTLHPPESLAGLSA